MLTFFTPSEANSILPEVSSILHQLLERKNNAVAARMELDRLSAEGNAEQAEQIRARIQALIAEIERGVTSLEEMGCIVRHIDEGIVDFPAMRFGRQVYLCWRLGEPTVSFWHDMSTGFAGRQRITERETTKAYV